MFQICVSNSFLFDPFKSASLGIYSLQTHAELFKILLYQLQKRNLFLYRATTMGVLALLRNRRKVAGLAWQAMALRGLQSTSALLEPAPKPVPLSKLKDSFLDGTSSTYLEELEERYRANPASVDKTWASFFNSMGK